MKRTLITVALLAAVPLSYAQTSSPGPAPTTGPTGVTPGMPSNPTGNQSIATPTNPVVSPLPGSAIGSVGSGPTSSGSSVGGTIQSQPLPPTPSPGESPNLGGTSIQPGVLGSTPASPGVIGSPSSAGPCIGTIGTNSCPPATQ